MGFHARQIFGPEHRDPFNDARQDWLRVKLPANNLHPTVPATAAPAANDGAAAGKNSKIRASASSFPKKFCRLIFSR